MAGGVELGLHRSSLVSRICFWACSIDSTEVDISTSATDLGLEESYKFLEARKT